MSTPLIAIRTPDPTETVEEIERGLGSTPPILHWDIARGLQWRNDEGLKACWTDIAENDATAPLPESEQEKRTFAADLGLKTQNPFETLLMIVRAPQGTIVFFANAHRIIPDNPPVTQAIWNLRDLFMRNKRTLVLLCPDIALPAELQQDVLILTEPLPDRTQLGTIVSTLFADTKQDQPPSETIALAVDALSGLAAFPAGQAAAESLKRDGLDIDGLRDRTNVIINATPGLSVNTSRATFDDLGGLFAIKDFLRRLCFGKRAPRVFVRIEEIEKVFGGLSGDNTGVTQEALGTLLSYMQDRQVNGLIAVGIAGGGKSEISNAAGNTFGKRTINCDLSAMKASLVGESKARLDAALKIISSISGDEVFIVATCNALTNIPPELKRRFRMGIWFWDLPDRAERAPIWDIYRRKFEIPGSDEMPNDEGWTGAEIRQCCENAWTLSCSLLEASKLVVPVSRSSPESLDALRKQASGRFLSASYPGVYRMGGPAKVVSIEPGRSIAMED